MQLCYNIIQTLCKGIKTLHKNCLCSAFNGKANPLMMLPSISKSSPTPLKCSVSQMNLKNITKNILYDNALQKGYKLIVCRL